MIFNISDNVNTQTWFGNRWDFTSLNFVSEARPPSLATFFVGWEPERPVWLGVPDILVTPTYPTIDMAQHQDLIQQSLKEYKDIWRDLAQR